MQPGSVVLGVVMDALKTLPRKIKVGPYTYTVQIVDGWVKYGDTDCWATIDHATFVLSIGTVSNCQPNILIGKVLHELLHAIAEGWHVFGGKDQAEEHVVERFERGLVAVLADNPGLLRWLSRTVR